MCIGFVIAELTVLNAIEANSPLGMELSLVILVSLCKTFYGLYGILSITLQNYNAKNIRKSARTTRRQLLIGTGNVVLLPTTGFVKTHQY